MVRLFLIAVLIPALVVTPVAIGLLIPIAVAAFLGAPVFLAIFGILVVGFTILGHWSSPLWLTPVNGSATRTFRRSAYGQCVANSVA